MNTVVTEIPDLASELPPDAKAVPDWLEHAL